MDSSIVKQLLTDLRGKDIIIASDEFDDYEGTLFELTDTYITLQDKKTFTRIPYNKINITQITYEK